VPTASAARQAVRRSTGSGGGSYDSCPPSLTSFVGMPSPETQRSSWIPYGSRCQPQTNPPSCIRVVYRKFPFLSRFVHFVHPHDA